jgi:hypothetical protein
VLETPEPDAPVEPSPPLVAEPPETPTTPPTETTVEPVEKPRPNTPQPVMLTPKSVGAVLSKSTRKLLACGDQFLTELPAERRVVLQLTIKNSGEVREAKVIEPAAVVPGLAKCLETRAKQVKFPLNRNVPEFAIKVPMRFNVAN